MKRKYARVKTKEGDINVYRVAKVLDESNLKVYCGECLETMILWDYTIILPYSGEPGPLIECLEVGDYITTPNNQLALPITDIKDEWVIVGINGECKASEIRRVHTKETFEENSVAI